MKTLVIIPAYNEEECIEKVVNDVLAQNVDVIVINDGSKDNTSINAKKTKAHVIDLPFNLGIGGAVQTGYLYAYKNDYDVAIQFDGDGQHNSVYINEMIKVLNEKNVDMVIGSRFINTTGYKQTFMRMLGNKIIGGMIKLYTGKKIYDTTSGYRAVNKRVIKKFANDYPSDYPEPDTNLRLLRQKYKIEEIPVEMNQRNTGKSSITPLKSIYYMIKVSLAMFICTLEKGDKDDI